MPDPKLQAVVLEIHALLQKNDIAGVVMLASPSHTHFSFELSPSWTCARLDANGMLRVRALRQDYATKEEHQRIVTATAGMILGFRTTALHCADTLSKVAKAMGKQMEISHWDKLEPPLEPLR